MLIAFPSNLCSINTSVQQRCQKNEYAGLEIRLVCLLDGNRLSFVGMKETETEFDC